MDLNKKYNLEYNGRNYIYGVERKRDYPTRGLIGDIFFIKIELGYKFLTKYKIIYQENYSNHFLAFALGSKESTIEIIKGHIDDYVIKSRRLKLSKLKNIK